MMSMDRVSGLMTVSRLIALAIIDKSEGPVSGVDISENEFFECSDTTARNSIKTLLDKGYIVSEPNLGDARKVEYNVTSEGKEILSKHRKLLCNTE